MRIQWQRRLGQMLGDSEPGLWESFHENSKIHPLQAQALAAQFSVSREELFVSSRAFKQLVQVPSVALPTVGADNLAMPLGDALAGRRSDRELGGTLALADLSKLLQLGLGINAIVDNEAAGVSQPLRAWPSAGGLYPLDVYVVAREVAGLDPWPYHFNPVRHQLERVPADFEVQTFSAAFFWQEFVVNAAAVLVLAAVFDRTVAKYGDRGYRLVLLDAGHAAQNVLLCAQATGVAATPVGGFSDDALSALLGLDGSRESAVYAIALGGSPS